ARFYGTVRRIHSGPVKEGRTFNFHEANLERTYGANFLDHWKDTALTRLLSWGFNTVGNWSDQRLYKNGRVPYVATASVSGNHARLSSGSDYWGKMHDPFDSRFARSVRGGLRGVVPLVKGDPWCVGYFVDNELSWGGFGDEGGRYGLALGALGSPADGSPAKRAFLDRLKQKYGEIARLNTAWQTTLSDWQAIEPSWKPASPSTDWSQEFKADLTGFVKELARTYFKTIRAELKAADPDHLYLGCRFAWRTEEAVAAAAEFCDVVSFNIYDRRVDPAKWGFLTSLGRPAIIGEFHVGALDRGMFHPGLVSARDQQERAAIFTDYVTSVLDNPALVGCHWFQYVDEPLTGRSFDGENYNIGFLTVTDTPYPEMVAAARAINRQAYARRAGKP
ncbi:MAG: beta-galactosidase, partial [Isosphaeraceae bacterium]